MPLHLNYICVCIDKFVHHTTVSALIYFYISYNLIVGFNSFFVFCSIYLWCIGYSTTVSLSHICLY